MNLAGNRIFCRLHLHSWGGCKCRICGKIRESHHEWNGCKCCTCDATRDEGHSWDGCKCSTCGAIRNQYHSWDGCVCTKCGSVSTDEDAHQWVWKGRQGVGADICSKCNASRIKGRCPDCYGSGYKTVEQAREKDPEDGWWPGYPPTPSNVRGFARVEMPPQQVTVKCERCQGTGWTGRNIKTYPRSIRQ